VITLQSSSFQKVCAGQFTVFDDVLKLVILTFHNRFQSTAIVPGSLCKRQFHETDSLVQREPTVNIVFIYQSNVVFQQIRFVELFSQHFNVGLYLIFCSVDVFFQNEALK
jgi:hypothetical protein